jgi:hypothetical protein
LAVSVEGDPSDLCRQTINNDGKYQTSWFMCL